MMSNEISVLDWNSDSFVDDLVFNLRQIGFAIIKDYTNINLLVSEAYEEWDKFFNSEDKYYYFGNLETPEGYITVDYDGKINLKEDFYFFPASLCPQFLKEITTEVYNNLYIFAQQLLKSILSHMKLPSTENLLSPTGLLRIINYPSLLDNKNLDVAATSGVIRNPDHKDKNLLTILPAANQPGLEFLLPNGEWYKAFYEYGTLIVNGGILLESLTDGDIKAVIHRVVNPSDNKKTYARKSMALFIS